MLSSRPAAGEATPVRLASNAVGGGYGADDYVPGWRIPGGDAGAEELAIAAVRDRLRTRSRAPLRTAQSLVAGVLLAALPLLAYGQTPSPATGPGFAFKDIVDVTLVTGSQASGALDRAMTAARENANLRAAFGYMESKGRRFAPEGFLNFQFTRASTRQRYTLTYLTFVDAQPRPEFPLRDTHHIIVIAESPRTGVRVWVASAVVSPDKREADVREDAAVIDGKLDPTRGIWRAILKCSMETCIAASIGCVAGGAALPACLTLGCGSGVIACAVAEMLFPG